MPRVITQEKLEGWLRQALERGDFKEADLLTDIIGCCEESPDNAQEEALANDSGYAEGYNRGFSDGVDSVGTGYLP